MVGNASENLYADDTLLSRLDRKLGKLEDAMSIASSFIILGLMFFGTINVIGRKVFSAPLWGYNDLVTLFMVAFSFLAISAMQRVGGHIRMELLVRRMRGRTMWIAEFIGVFLAISIMTVLTYYSYESVIRAIELGDSTIDRELATWPSKMWVPIAFAVLIARLFLQMWGYARLIIDPDAQPIAVPLMHSETELADKEIQDAFGDDDEEVHELKA
jgi:C4-dicarboxylate transporter, DctQ subunit